MTTAAAAKALRKPELVCPAGSLPALKAAVDNGADWVYLGLRDSTNARNFAGLNFDRVALAEGLVLDLDPGLQVVRGSLKRDGNEIAHIDLLIRATQPGGLGQEPQGLPKRPQSHAETRGRSGSGPLRQDRCGGAPVRGGAGVALTQAARGRRPRAGDWRAA